MAWLGLRLVSQRPRAQAAEPQFCSVTRLMEPSTSCPPSPFWAVSVDWGLGVREPARGGGSPHPCRGRDGAGLVLAAHRVCMSQASGEEAPGASPFLPQSLLGPPRHPAVAPLSSSPQPPPHTTHSHSRACTLRHAHKYIPRTSPRLHTHTLTFKDSCFRPSL